MWVLADCIFWNSFLALAVAWCFLPELAVGQLPLFKLGRKEEVERIVQPHIPIHIVLLFIVEPVDHSQIVHIKRRSPTAKAYYLKRSRFYDVTEETSLALNGHLELPIIAMHFGQTFKA